MTGTHLKLGVAMAVATIFTASARADETAITFNESPISIGEGGRAVFGWQFSTLTDIRISSIGLYDYYLGEGFAAAHPVGIWDISNPSQPLVTAILPAGTVAPLVSAFRYVSVDPVILSAGHDYAIGALYNADDDTVGTLNNPGLQLTQGPGLQFDGFRSGGGSSSVLTFPDNFDPSLKETFGPNFTYTVVPEPSILSLCALGGAALLVRRKSRADGSR